MCIDIVAETSSSVHHELGHNFYQRAYDHQPFLFRGSANDAYEPSAIPSPSPHPDYLVKLGFIQKVHASKAPTMLKKPREDRLPAFGPADRPVALAGLLRRIPPEKYNQAWWALRLKYEGSRPRPRGEEFFDPGAKYHVPATCPTRAISSPICSSSSSTRRSASRRLQGSAPSLLHYGNKKPAKLNAMLERASRTWPDALEKIAGTRQNGRQCPARVLRSLEKWLEQQNQATPSAGESGSVLYCAAARVSGPRPSDGAATVRERMRNYL